jgi:hypothetical protein
MDPYERKRKSRVVLEEEEYIEKIEAIIERDYFPTSSQLKAHSHLPQGSTDPRSDKIESLSTFFEIYNSEDNDSFEILQEKTLAEKRRKFHWLYESPGGKSAGMLMWYHQQGKVLTIEEREKMDRLLDCPTTVGDDRPNGCETWRFRVRNQLMFPPELEASKDICFLPSSDPSALARLSSIETSESNPLPNSSDLTVAVVSDSTHPRVGSSPTRSLNLPMKEISPTKAKSDQKLMPPPSIIPQNTRLAEVTKLEDIRHFPSSASPLEMPHSPSSVGTDREYHSYRSVCMTPSPLPGFGSAHLRSPVITWGEICGTPNVLKGSSSDVNPFIIAEVSNREKCARLLELQKTQKLKKDATKLESSSKKTNNISRMLKTPLTPAGRALAEKLSSNSTSDWGALIRPNGKRREQIGTPASGPQIKTEPRISTSMSAIRTDDLLRL